MLPIEWVLDHIDIAGNGSFAGNVVYDLFESTMLPIN